MMRPGSPDKGKGAKGKDKDSKGSGQGKGKDSKGSGKNAGRLGQDFAQTLSPGQQYVFLDFEGGMPGNYGQADVMEEVPHMGAGQGGGGRSGPGAC